MAGERTFGQPIPDDKLSAFMNVLYNVWFKKWKKTTDEDSFDSATRELSTIMEQGKEYPVVEHMCMSLLYELDARRKGGYTKTTRKKPLTL